MQEPMKKRLITLFALAALGGCASTPHKTAETAPVVEDPGPIVSKTLHIDTVPQGAAIWVMFHGAWDFQGYSPVDVPMKGPQNDRWFTYIKAIPTAPGQYTQQAYTWPGSADSWTWTLFMYNTSTEG